MSNRNIVLILISAVVLFVLIPTVFKVWSVRTQSLAELVREAGGDTLVIQEYPNVITVDCWLGNGTKLTWLTDKIYYTIGDGAFKFDAIDTNEEVRIINMHCALTKNKGAE